MYHPCMKHLNQDPELHEELFNPPPGSYRVPRWLKIAFFISMLGGFVLYGSLIFERHRIQNLFLKENHLAPIKLSGVMVPNLDVLFVEKNQIMPLKNLTDGHWTLLNLWATWCRTCQQEMPSLALLEERMKDRLKILALSLDEDKTKVDKYIKHHNPNFMIAFDIRHEANVLFGVQKYPETFLIAPNGQIIAQFSGARDFASNEAIEYFERQIESFP